MDRKHHGSNHRPARGVSPHEGFNYFPYRNQGPAGYYMNSYYDQDETSRYRGNGFDALASVNSLENTRNELLRKLDELETELSLSCEMREKSRGRIGADKRMDSAELHHPYARHHGDSLTISNAVNKLPHASDDFKTTFVSRAYGHDFSFVEPYTERGYSHEFVNNCQPKMFDTPPHRVKPRYMSQPYHKHFPDYYADTDRNLYLNLPPTTEPTGLYNQWWQNEPYNPQSHQPYNPTRHRLQGRTYGALTSHQSYVDAGDGGFNNFQRGKVAVPRRGREMLHPVFGGAPFITCSKCYELLRLPKKQFLLAKKQQKLKCGACSSIISCELGKDAPVSANVHHIPAETEGSSLLVTENVSQNGDSEPISGMKSNSRNSEKQLDPPSILSPSMKEQTTGILVFTNNDSPTNKAQVTDVKLLLLPSSSSAEFLKQSSDNISADQLDEESTSKRSELEETAVERQNLEEVPPASETEIDMSWNEISVDAPHNTSEITTEDDPVGELCSLGLVQERSEDLTRLNQNIEVGGSYVFVNGHLIPDVAVKQAEKLAGPIEPGEYWYDSRAGFWGVMGFPCLGIVMPNIEEFNYPLPVRCGAGNTGVYVNGRELHHKDLELLCSIGLPTTTQRSYLVSISGDVVDAQTGEELDNLGKLAPTVERANRGFGMKVPRSIAQLQC